VGLLLPGDFCDLHIDILGEMDHAIRTLTPCRVVAMTRETVDELITSTPNVVRALWWAALVNEAITREWLVSMGQRTADAQMAHLFCELYVRLGVVGLVDGDSYDLPFTQEELGDVLGLSVVHVNRVLQRLRGEGLVEWRRGRMRIPDFPRLAEFADFSPNYLHLRNDRPHSADIS
jgi:CRP-like cAMP-binding protein